ncbi:gluconokinase [Psychromonas hadalis]|uniref:gluconokinase n=1 Tax=Psychromonas hadalis TaxID=211669 RepID=UPI0003B4C909|nr:gluconokinase [Psychromonas hadalis]
MNGNKIVVMGVSGCGKSLIGERLAEQLQLPFFDGDDYHCADNVLKMSLGIALTDQDRQGWLETLSALLNRNSNAVLACSALTIEYRRVLKENNPELLFIYLKGDFDTIWQRHSKRENHYFNGKGMLESQFNTLQEPTEKEALVIDIKKNVSEIIADIIQKTTLNDLPK